MTIQELFSSKPIVEIIVEIEEQILEHFPDTAKRPLKPNLKRVIEELLKVRKRLLDEHFIFDETTKVLLQDFNEAIKSELLRMRAEAIKMHEAILQLYPDKTDVCTEATCFLGYEYSATHPIQTERAHQMWEVLNATYDCYMPLYADGVDGGQIFLRGRSYPSEVDVLWLGEKTKNWNLGLDRTLSADMSLVYAFRNLWEHNAFSIYDLLWVRDFNIEIKIEYDYKTTKYE